MEVTAENGIVKVDGKEVPFKEILEAILPDEKSLMALRDFVDSHKSVEFILR